MKRQKIQLIALVALALALGVGLGAWWFAGPNPEKARHQHDHQQQKEDATYTCSMHPEIRQQEPGQCPICGMDLVKAQNTENQHQLPENALRMSATARRLAEVRSAPVRKVPFREKLSLSGRVISDSSELYSQTAHIGGRLERLNITHAGQWVRKGEEIARVYSPELVRAQQELFEAYDTRQSQSGLYQAARQKLANWKLSKRQIDAILEKGAPLDQFPILSDYTGEVRALNFREGDHVKVGSRLYQVLPRNRYAVDFDLYEKDLSKVALGDSVQFALDALPGERFRGALAFLDKQVNGETRVVHGRVYFRHPDAKPGMLARGQLQLRGDSVLAVPRSAVLWGGERSVVFVKEAQGEEPYYQVREVTLGPAMGDRVVIRSGLALGDTVVSKGAFSIDAAAQLANKPSMMHQKAATQGLAHSPKTWEEIMEAYQAWQAALYHEQATAGAKAGAKLSRLLQQADKSGQVGGFKAPSPTASLQAQRQAFRKASEWLIGQVEEAEPLPQDTLYRQHCPMAFEGEGADWLSQEKAIRNPYFGSKMPHCGSIKQVYP